MKNKEVKVNTENFIHLLEVLKPRVKYLTEKRLIRLLYLLAYGFSSDPFKGDKI